MTVNIMFISKAITFVNHLTYFNRVLEWKHNGTLVTPFAYISHILLKDDMRLT